MIRGLYAICRAELCTSFDQAQYRPVTDRADGGLFKHAAILL